MKVGRKTDRLIDPYKDFNPYMTILWIWVPDLNDLYLKLGPDVSNFLTSFQSVLHLTSYPLRLPHIILASLSFGLVKFYGTSAIIGV